MGRVLSIDLAYKKTSDFGVCLIEEKSGRTTAVSFPSPEDVGFEEPPDATQCAQAIFGFCQQHSIAIVFLDGPQGWKEPTNGLEHMRICERRLNTPAKTGTEHCVKPKNYTGFVEFSTEIFRRLVELGAKLIVEPTIEIPSDHVLLVAESFPRSAWGKLGLSPLPGKTKARPDDVRRRLEKLKTAFGLTTDRDDSTHDELCALVAGLAGIAILRGDTQGYIADGWPPTIIGGKIHEGFIVNPRIPKSAAKRGISQVMPVAKAAKKRDHELAPDASTLERMLYYLKLTRESEYRIERVLYRQGKIVGGVYVGRGQEAIGVGSAIQLIEGDVALPSHRDFSSFVIRGVSLRQIFCNWMARANGPTRGRENTLHIGDLKLGLIPIISPLGDTCPVACGVALTFKQRGRKNVTLVHFGEGTTSRGDVHEAMNLAAVMKLPVIFICNNNAYAYSTPTKLQYAVEDLSVRGPAYGMPGVTIDGNDVLAVYAAVAKAIALARSGGGPSFIESKTFRMTGHSAHDAAEYVPKELLEKEAKRDPIARLEKFLLARRLMTRERIRDMDQTVQKEIDDAVAYAESSPLPEGATAIEGVYCGPDCWWNRAIG